MNKKNNIDRVHDDVFNSIKTLMDKARNEVAREVNHQEMKTKKVLDQALKGQWNKWDSQTKSKPRQDTLLCGQGIL